MLHMEYPGTLEGPVENSRPMRPYSPRLSRQVATLERRAPQVVDAARATGVDISYLGVAPLFPEPRAYAGSTTDWVIGPLEDARQELVPADEQLKLTRLVEAGVDFPILYVAHEMPKGQLPVAGLEIGRHQRVDQRSMALARAATPLPHETTDVSERLGRSSGRLLDVMAKALPIAGAVAIAPLVLAGVALGALARLDPMLFGVYPVGRGYAGEPATWFLLAQWYW